MGESKLRSVKPDSVAGKDLRRIFFAIDLPSATITSTEKLLESFGDIPPAFVRWAHTGNMHITLKFLGEVEKKKIPAIIKAAKNAFSNFGPMALSIEGMGIFPNHNRPRVLWLGVQGDTGKLALLESSLSKHLEPLGFAPDQRPFSAHLTIGRVKNENARGRLVRLVRKYRGFVVGDVPVEKVILYESKLDTRGAVYSVLESFPLEQ